MCSPSVHAIRADNATRTLTVDVGFYVPTAQKDVRAQLMTLSDEGFVEFSRDEVEKLQKLARPKGARAKSQSEWKSCLNCSEWSFFNKHVWIFLQWEWPSHVLNVNEFLDYKTVDVGSGLRIAEGVRVKF